MTTEQVIYLISAAIISGAVGYVIYLFKQRDSNVDKKFSDLKAKDDSQQLLLETLKNLIERQIKMAELNDQRDHLNLKLVNKDIELVKNDVKSIKEGIDQKITLINTNLERVLTRMDRQDQRWTEFYEKQSNR